MAQAAVEFDAKAVLANVDSLQKSLLETNPLEELVGNEILRLSQMEVPHDEGTLQNSGVVEVIDGVTTIGYHEAYAARLHEHPEYRFQKGRKGKYLEDPILRNTEALGIMLVKTITDKLEGSI